jgi:hypothetical protein
MTKKAKKAAKKLFPKKSNGTRPFSHSDYLALPKQ